MWCMLDMEQINIRVRPLLFFLGIKRSTCQGCMNEWFRSQLLWRCHFSTPIQAKLWTKDNCSLLLPLPPKKEILNFKLHCPFFSSLNPFWLNHNMHSTAFPREQRSSSLNTEFIRPTPQQHHHPLRHPSCSAAYPPVSSSPPLRLPGRIIPSLLQI